MTNGEEVVDYTLLAHSLIHVGADRLDSLCPLLGQVHWRMNLLSGYSTVGNRQATHYRTISLYILYRIRGQVSHGVHASYNNVLVLLQQLLVH